MLDMVPVPDRVISGQVVIMGGGEIVRPDQVSELSERGGGMDAGNFDILIARIQTVQKRVSRTGRCGLLRRESSSVSIRKSPGQSLLDGSPRLIAAFQSFIAF